TMKLRQPNTQYQLEVGVWEVGYDENQEPIEQFVPVATFHNADNTVTEVSCDFASYTGDGTRIAFRNTLKTANYNYSYNYLDDITLTLTEAKIAASSNANVIDEMGVENYLESIVVYPNPTVGELHIGAMDVQKVECYNQMGQLVAVYDNDRDINISSLSQGVYTLRITVPQGVTMRKVVKK
ncbi:MAG: T9SS type A sorting domain-containing protein, partial [Bacteroidales bacterium]|nr:T9SS type A sorting domain-containing protein [Bacteroidales bacterium]